MSLESDPEIQWADLATAVRTLPELERQRLSRALRTFAHDLRQSFGQVHSAEELLRRSLGEAGVRDEDRELLDILRAANRRAMTLVSEFAEGFIERIL